MGQHTVRAHVHWGRMIVAEPFRSPDTGTWYGWCQRTICTVSSVTIILDGSTQTPVTE